MSSVYKSKTNISQNIVLNVASVVILTLACLLAILNIFEPSPIELLQTIYQ